MTTIIIGADHKGYELKEQLKEVFSHEGISINDLTPQFIEGDDYPSIAQEVARKVNETGDKGVLICGSGIGMSIAANRISGTRAALCRSTEDALMARKDNNANICCLGGKNTSYTLAHEIITTFVNETFLGDLAEGKRHLRRIEQIEK